MKPALPPRSSLNSSRCYRPTPLGTCCMIITRQVWCARSQSALSILLTHTHPLVRHRHPSFGSAPARAPTDLARPQLEKGRSAGAPSAGGSNWFSSCSTGPNHSSIRHPQPAAFNNQIPPPTAKVAAQPSSSIPHVDGPHSAAVSERAAAAMPAPATATQSPSHFYPADSGSLSNPFVSAPQTRMETLEPGWEQAQTADGKTYYYHCTTRETSWTKPLMANPLA